jgi:hypothetical protein
MIENGWYWLGMIGFRSTSLLWLFAPVGFRISVVGRLVYTSSVLVGKLIN